MQKRATNGQKLEVQKVRNKFKKSTIEKAKKAKWNLFPGQVKNGISNFIYTYGAATLHHMPPHCALWLNGVLRHLKIAKHHKTG